MRKFHSLAIASLQNETSDSLRIGLDVPAELRADFDFLPGQHLPVQTEIEGKIVRRTYSICSVPGQWPLEIGIRIQPDGLFSEYVAANFASGDHLEVMPPFGQFHVNVDAENKKTYLVFAAGSGITPILSIVRAILENEPASKLVVFYANRRQKSTMFIDDLQGLKNRFTERLQLYFLFTREEQEFPILGGRLDLEKTLELFDSFCSGLEPDEAFVCGPDSMIDSVRGALLLRDMPAESIHVERYGAPKKRDRDVENVQTSEHSAEITVIMDGHKKSFGMSKSGSNIVDAAADQGIELPYSCKGGVCATCRTHVRDGEVSMRTNYGLEPWEVEKGYVLACQSVPLSNKVTLDYDKT